RRAPCWFVSLLVHIFFFFASHRSLRALHSFPTRRSSDLARRVPSVCLPGPRQPRGAPGARPRAALRRIAEAGDGVVIVLRQQESDRKSTRLNSSHLGISYAVFCLKKKKKEQNTGLQVKLQ